MHQSKVSISVWPGYVAAVASLVLSLLLLAGVLVVAITQIGRLVDGYNDQLMVAAIEDERRAIEMESLRAKGREPEIRQVASEVVKPRPAVLSKTPVSSAAAQSTEAVGVSAAVLEAQLRDRSDSLATVRAELAKLQNERASKLPDRQSRDVVRFYRFVFGPGVQGLDEAVLEQLQARMRADGVTATSATWVLETGVAGLDSVASREMYRLMLNIRSQLVDAGFSSDQVSLVLNREVAPQELPGARAQLRPGELPMLLRPINKPAVSK